MKQPPFFIVALTLAVVLCQPLFAAKWRISNVPGVTANFSTLQAANNSASVNAGDTVYIEGSSVAYDAPMMNKKLVVVGPGYFLGENDSTQYYKSAATLANLTLDAGSEGSVFTGVSVSGTLVMNAGSMVIKRCRIGTGFNVSSSNNIIVQNWLAKLNFISPSQNNLVKNNYMSAPSSQNAISMAAGTNAVILNNVITSNQTINDALYRNNIATGNTSVTHNFSATGSCTVTNNIGGSTQYSFYPGNLVNVSMATVFICWTSCTGYSNDRRYKLLQPSSPAIGYGYNGVDCGIFGGEDPYVLSGVPNFPAIWDLSIVRTSVSVKAKSH